MRECTVEQSTAIYKANFARMLPALPTPGTTWFAALSKTLSPFGLSPGGIELEAPTNRLDDVVLSFSLLVNRLKLKLSYGWFEFIISNLYDEDEAALIEIATKLLETLHEIDAEFQQHSAQYRSYTHLKLASAEADALIKQHLNDKGSPELVPDAFAYELNWNELKEEEHARVIVARSAKPEAQLFVDLTIDYRAPGDPYSMLERMNQDYDRALNVLGLQLES